MSSQPTEQAAMQAPQAPANTSDKELNFRALESRYKKQLDEERQERERLQRELDQKMLMAQKDDDEEDNEPYVDKKRLRKEQARFGQQIKQETQSEIQKAVHSALQAERKQNWLKSNSDFYDVMEKHTEKFAQHDPELAETILEMPDSFERQKLVYKNIKALGLDKPPVTKESTIQDKINANKKSPYYQPSGVGSAPYGMVGDFSSAGQKSAYAKMQELKQRLTS